MLQEEQKAFIRRFYEEVWNHRHYAAAADFFTPDSVRHERSGPVRGGAEGIARNAEAWCAAFPDTHCVVDAVIAEGDMAVVRWTITATHRGAWRGVPATGRPIRFTGANIFRLAGGKVAEIWNFRDDLGLFEQLGVVTSLEPRHDTVAPPGAQEPIRPTTRTRASSDTPWSGAER